MRLCGRSSVSLHLDVRTSLLLLHGRRRAAVAPVPGGESAVHPGEVRPRASGPDRRAMHRPGLGAGAERDCEKPLHGHGHLALPRRKVLQQGDAARLLRQGRGFPVHAASFCWISTSWVLSPLEPVETDRVWGKIVDADNPPLHVLERIFAQAGVDVPGIVPCDWGTGDTVATNFNGGFLYVPRGFVSRMQSAWRGWAEFLHARPDLFESPEHRGHTDQISFALALAAERLPCRHLSANWNFPLHSPGVPRSFKSEAAVRGLHYHWCLDAFGLVDPVFRDHSVVDDTVRRVNAALGARDASLFFDLYKRHLAREAVRLVPVAEKPLFCEDFIARTWKRRQETQADPACGHAQDRHHRPAVAPGVEPRTSCRAGFLVSGTVEVHARAKAPAARGRAAER